MKHIVFAPRSRNARRTLTGGALLGLLLAAGAVAIGDVSPEAKRSGARSARQSLSLFAEPVLILRTNQIECGIDNEGNVCANVFNSPTAAGGAWPVGSPNAYIYNTGLQIGGIMGAEVEEWANDTVGAYFFDARGNQPSGSGVTNIYNSLDPDDLADWPAEAVIGSASEQEDFFGDQLFDDALVGRNSISQQDTWVQYWDGSPTRITNRQHPMGLLVTQRSLAWNYPAGNESMLYFVYTFENVTNTPEFQLPNELQFFGGDDVIPASGIPLTEVYAAFSTDMDISNAGNNFSSAVLPFDLGMSYHGGFSAPEFSYPPDLFFPPFFTNAPGIVGIKYLQSPTDPATGQQVGLTLFSGTDNSATGFPDPLGDKQLWRYLSGNLEPAAGDFPCNNTPEVDTGIPETTERSICYLNQTAADTRFYQASGPFDLNPGDRATIVVSYILAPTVQTMPDGSPSGILANANSNDNPPGVASFHPGFPSSRGCDQDGLNCTVTDNTNDIKPLERGAGWVVYTGPDPTGRGNGALESPENKYPILDPSGVPYVATVPGSLLGRAYVAQTIFNNKFLLGFAPTQPEFFMAPGNGQVTVAWNPSASEELGDPYYNVAQGDTTSLLYNPNYRGLAVADGGEVPGDVEGYRVYRGTTPGNLQLIAQYDYPTSSFTDVTCETVGTTDDLSEWSESTPEGTRIGFAAGEVCPDDFLKVTPINLSLLFNNGSSLVPGGGVLRLEDGRAFDNQVEQVGIDNWPGVPLEDTGIPWGYVDSDVVNNFTYFYAVSAFDINSAASGPYSLESTIIGFPVTPRQDEQNLELAGAITGFLSGDDGAALDPNAPLPTIDPETGIFSGPMPPTNALSFDAAPSLPRLQGEFRVSAVIDSFRPDPILQEACVDGFRFQSQCGRVYMTVDGEPVEVAVDISAWEGFYVTDTEATLPGPEIPYDEAALLSLGMQDFTQTGVSVGLAVQDESINFINWEGQQNRRSVTPNVIHGGARWFSGTEETTPDPAQYIRVGHLAEVDSVWVPVHHTPLDPTGTTGTSCTVCLPNSGTVQYYGYYLGGFGRAADFRVTWNGGAASIRDVTHNVDVPFSGNVGSSWGFLNEDGDGDGVVSWWDFFCIGDMWAEFEEAVGPGCPAPVLLEQTPTIHSIALNTAGDPTTGTVVDGFTLYLNAMRHFFAASSLPPDGTVWTLRTYSGTVSTDVGDGAVDPSGYVYHEVYDGSTGLRPGLIPNAALTWESVEGTTISSSWNLDLVHTVPDPYLATSQYDRSPTSKQLNFVNLPVRATIRIYTLTGVLVEQLEHEDLSGGGREVWNLRNRNNQFVASGVYFFHVVTPEGDERVGKFTIVNFAGQN